MTMSARAPVEPITMPAMAPAPRPLSGESGKAVGVEAVDVGDEDAEGSETDGDMDAPMVLGEEKIEDATALVVDMLGVVLDEAVLAVS